MELLLINSTAVSVEEISSSAYLAYVWEYGNGFKIKKQIQKKSSQVYVKSGIKHE